MLSKHIVNSSYVSNNKITLVPYILGHMFHFQQLQSKQMCQQDPVTVNSFVYCILHNLVFCEHNDSEKVNTQQQVKTLLVFEENATVYTLTHGIYYVRGFQYYFA